METFSLAVESSLKSQRADREFAAIFIPWQGKWPPYLALWMEGAKFNSHIHWYIIGDVNGTQVETQAAHNVRYLYEPHIWKRAKLLLSGICLPRGRIDGYKLADLKPVLPYLFYEISINYNWVMRLLCLHSNLSPVK